MQIITNSIQYLHDAALQIVLLQGYNAAGLLGRLWSVVNCFAHNIDDNIAQAETLRTEHKVSRKQIQTRLGYDLTKQTVKAKGHNSPFFFLNINVIFDATQGQSRCSSHTS